MPAIIPRVRTVEFTYNLQFFLIKLEKHWIQTAATELEKVPSSASVLVRKDFGIRENLRKAQGGKKIESSTILWEEKTQRKND